MEGAQEKFERDVNCKVLADAMESFLLVKRNGGSLNELCVRGGVVLAALVQAREESLYREWRPIQEKICAAAMGTR